MSRAVGRPDTPSGADAVVLAGGRARRLGGEDKLVIPGPGGTPLGAVLTAVGDVVGERGTVVVVGWARDVVDAKTPGRLVWTREEPAFAGPFAAVMTAVPHLSAPTVVVCAGDLPSLTSAGVARLVAARESADADAAVYVDADDRRQPLCAAYRLEWLLRRRRDVADPRDVAARALLDGAVVVAVADVDAVTSDIDTPDDVARWRGEPV